MYKIIIKSEDYAIPYNLEMMLHILLLPKTHTKAYSNIHEFAKQLTNKTPVP